MGHAPGLALHLLLSARVRRALGRVLTPLLLGLLRLLLRGRNYLIRDSLGGGFYMHAYEMIECNTNYTISKLRNKMSCGLSAPKWRTVRSTIPQTHQNQLRLWTNFKTIGRTVRSKIADHPRFNSAKPPEATTPLDKF